MTSELDLLSQLLLRGTPSAPDAGTPPPASFDSGTVTALVDDTHVMVDLGDKTVTVFVPASLSGMVAVGSGVQVRQQENTYVLDSVTSQVQAGPVPVGTVIMWIATSIPAGWLRLDGSSYSTTTYPALFDLLGTGTLPNMADRFPIGVSGTKAVKSTGGNSSITQTVNQMPSHNHDISVDNTTLLYPATGNVASIIYPVVNGAETTFTGGGQAMNIQNPYMGIYFLIKAS